MNQSIVEVIEERYASLTKKQKQIMDCMLSDPESMVFMTLKELAAKASVTEVTVLNACTALGYGTYNDVKYEFRKYVSDRSIALTQQDIEYFNPRVSKQDLSNKDQLLYDIVEEGLNLNKLACSKIDADLYFQAAKMFLDASYVVVCGRGMSLVLAQMLSIRLSVIGVASIVVDTALSDNVQSILPMLGGHMLLTCISLADYYEMTVKLCEFGRQKHSKVLCITDRESHSPIVQYADIVLSAPADSRFFLNSPYVTMMIIDYLTSAINIEKNIWNSPRFEVNEEFSQLFKEE